MTRIDHRRMQHVAEVAGVSMMTVSRVINGHPNVRDEKRERVLTAIRELNYHPYLPARSLASRKTRIVATVLDMAVDHIDEELFRDLILGLQRSLMRRGYSMLLMSPQGGESYADSLLHSGVADGAVIISGSGIDRQSVRELVKEGFPTVLVGRREIPGAQPTFVSPDYRSAIMRAAEHLLALGHRQIALLADPGWEPGIDRIEGYVAAHAARGLQADPALLIIEGRESVAGGIERVLALGATALVGRTAKGTLEAIRVLQALGLAQSADFSLIGEQDSSASFYQFLGMLTARELTTFVLPSIQLGQAAGELLLALLGGEERPVANWVEVAFHPGETCASPPVR